MLSLSSVRKSALYCSAKTQAGQSFKTLIAACWTSCPLPRAKHRLPSTPSSFTTMLSYIPGEHMHRAAHGQRSILSLFSSEHWP